MSVIEKVTPPEHTSVIILALSPLIDIFIATIPGLNIIAPLIFWLMWRDAHPEVDQAGKAILNSQISWSIWLLISHVVFGALAFVFIGFLFIWIVPTLWIVYSIIQTIKVINGDRDYVMPWTIKFIK